MIRCFQITPVENHLTICSPTSIGLEKKNGGSSMRPNTGTLAKNCHSPSTTMATSTCNERSPILDTFKLPSSLQSRLLLGEGADQARRALGVAFQRLDHLVARHAFLERGRLQIGRDQRENVVMRRTGRCARSPVVRQIERAFATDIFVARFGDFAFGEA